MEKKSGKISLFYKLLLAVVLGLLLIFVYLRVAVLRPWLVDFEAAQPRHVSQEVFSQLFSPADWGRVYDLAGLEGDAYRDREGFVRSMEELTRGRTLTLVETSAGLSGNRRYIVKSDRDSLAAFTLRAGEEGEDAWRLDSVELLLPQTDTVSVRALEGQRVLVNGVELGEDCLVQTAEKEAWRYLPQGVQGRRTVVWQTQVSFARQARVDVLDQDGPVPLDHEEGSGSFFVQLQQQEPDAQQRGRIVGAAESYGRYMIREGTSAQLRQYFDSGSQIYHTIRSSELWVPDNRGCSFDNETISEYCSYGQDVFSARIALEMNVKRGNGSIKRYPIDTTLFFHRVDGEWLAYEMTNVDVQKEIVRTRLIFMDGGTEAGRMFVSSEDRGFAPPPVSPPEGRRFVGWATRERSGDRLTMTVRFRPGADGRVVLPADFVLEPAVLYAVYEAD